MIICVCTFTPKGLKTAQKIENNMTDMIFRYRDNDMSLDEWCKECFEKRLPVMFVGACGIAVRAISPYVKDKLYDSPVIVIDELGKYIIPILSGHMGGANDIAKDIGSRCDMEAVITTATDINHKFSIDVFASKNGFWIVNRDGIAKVSGRILRGQLLNVYIDPEIKVKAECSIPELKVIDGYDKADIHILTEKRYKDHQDGDSLITLVAKEYILGVGCKKGKTFEEIKSFLDKKMILDMDRQVKKITSIDLKKDEIGLLNVAQYYHIPFETYSAEQLLSLQGEFSHSDFVQNTTGVDNVCERSAIYGAQTDSAMLIQKKTSESGITLAVAKCNAEIISWNF